MKIKMKNVEEITMWVKEAKVKKLIKEMGKKGFYPSEDKVSEVGMTRVTFSRSKSLCFSGTVTGRFSSDTPNIGEISRKE